jgi:hypothetical protein
VDKGRLLQTEAPLVPSSRRAATRPREKRSAMKASNPAARSSLAYGNLYDLEFRGLNSEIHISEGFVSAVAA